MIKARPHIAAMASYALARVDIPDGVTPIFLNQNESAAQPSPRAIEAAANAANLANLYCDCDWIELCRAIADVHDLDTNALLIGAGSMELIAAMIPAFAGPGDEVLSTLHGYAYFRTAAQIADANYVQAPEVDLTVSVDALLSAVTPRTRFVCVANPGNPTGTRIPRSALLRLRDELPDDIILVIDEAYAEFADHLGERTFDLVGRGNTVVLRTFSKAYSLAGMRVGWGVFPPDIRREVHKLLIPNSVGTTSQAAATAAMRDQAYMRSLCEATAERRDRFAAGCRDLGLGAPQSFTNFQLVVFDDPEAATRADEQLRSVGVILRPMGGYGLAHTLRATIGSDDDMMKTFNVLRTFMDEEAA